MDETYSVKGENGFAIVAGLVERIIHDADVQSDVGDRKCRGVQAFLEDFGTPQAHASSGSKLKGKGPIATSVLAGFPDHLVVASYISPRDRTSPVTLNAVGVMRHQDIRGIVPIKVGGLLGGAPGLQVQAIDPDDGNPAAVTLFLNDLLSKKLVQQIRAEVTAWA
ncbi:MAG: hypothetical protein QM733_05485 [Ilumatobacteraceae bacterium]